MTSPTKEAKKYYIKPPSLQLAPSATFTSRPTSPVFRPSSSTSSASSASTSSPSRPSTPTSPVPRGAVLPPTNLTSRPRSPLRRPVSTLGLREQTNGVSAAPTTHAGLRRPVSTIGLREPNAVITPGAISAVGARLAGGAADTLRRPVSTIDMRPHPALSAITHAPTPTHIPTPRKSAGSRVSISSTDSALAMTTSMSPSGAGNVRVVVRARPLVQRELDASKRCILSMNSAAHSTTLHPPVGADTTMVKDKTFVFDESLWSVTDGSDNEVVTQEVLYERAGRELLDHSFAGYHTCLLAYGQTGSGKSYTMLGTEDEPGIIPRTCYDLFHRIEKMTTPTTTFTVKVSYFEIYNEHVFDLLSASTVTSTVGNALKVRESPVDGPYVKDLTTHSVRSFNDIEVLLHRGNKKRATAATNMNASSSRSHAVFTVSLKRIETDAVLADETTEETNSRIRFVDLAGSERVISTGATGTRLREGANINKSLTTLGRVISILADSALSPTATKTVVPYRDSTLTWLLKDSLGGNSKTAMIACVSPVDYDETLSTLRYASQAKHIKTQAVVNQDFISATKRDEQVAEMQDMITKLQDTLTKTSDSHRMQNDAQVQELEKFRKVIKYYEEKAEAEEAKRHAVVQENETVKRHNRLIAEHVRSLRRQHTLPQGITVPVEFVDEWRALLNDVSSFTGQLAGDLADVHQVRQVVSV
ncbi:P-loop containing nucleoside triphosphate hydrolase protein [Limtongia smithiae]|uniref:P-loop containing nucleoside triphosphate hydrolase protein n=1 Tax=Limtongia smithiae TaxID=1125753 RepID=UPI0034CE9C77